MVLGGVLHAWRTGSPELGIFYAREVLGVEARDSAVVRGRRQPDVACCGAVAVAEIAV